MQIVILCGGLATRLGNITKNVPKSMVKIDNKPFLEYQIEILKKHSFSEIVLCVGHLSEQIEKYFGYGEKFGVRIKYSYDGNKQLGPIGALKNANKLLGEIFFIMYGDSYIDIDFKEMYSYFKKYNKLGLMAVYKNNNKFDKSNLIVKDNMIADYGEKERTNEMIYIDYGTSIFKKDVLNFIPKETFYTTGQLFSKLISKNELLAYEVKKRFYHIGNPESLEEFSKFIKSQ